MRLPPWGCMMMHFLLRRGGMFVSAFATVLYIAYSWKIGLREKAFPFFLKRRWFLIFEKLLPSCFALINQPKLKIETEKNIHTNKQLWRKQGVKIMAKKHLSIAMGLFLLMTVLPFAVSAQSEGVAQDANTKTSPESREIALTIEGKIYEGIFVFTGKSIKFYSPSNSENWPENITVDGKPWNDLRKPFKLDYTPDFGKAGILEKDGLRKFEVDVTEKRFSLSLWVGNTIPDNHALAPFKAKLAMKNQLPHDDLAGYRPAKTTHIRGMNDGAYYKVYDAKMKALWEEHGIKEHKILLTGVIRGKGSFVFEGNTIRYLHEEGKMPYNIAINGQCWAMLNEPFELPFQVETGPMEILREKGDYPVKLNRIDDKSFELLFDDHTQRGGSYSITIIPDNSQQSK